MTERSSEKIGNVSLNYRFYQGTDQYSDGDIEDTLLDIVRQSDSYEEVLMRETDWALLYHLSPIRENLLEWYDFGAGKTLLEIGSGCGGMTGLFCRKCERVVAIDLSRRRSMINACRNKDADNLEIMVGNFEDIRIDEKFDYVTLIGVLEYSIYYINSDNPFVDMLKRARDYLKPGGKLIIAIENKYGIKYWAGAREDHTGKVADGLMGYPGVERVRTFSREGLEALLGEAGLSSPQFFYPLPDYKLPTEVYSQRRLPKSYPVIGNTPNYDQPRYSFFAEERVMNELIGEGMFELFANSYLVFCGVEAGETSREGCQALSVKYNSLRQPAFRVATEVCQDANGRFVRKRAGEEAARAHLETIRENSALLREYYEDIQVIQAEPNEIGLRFPYIEGRTLAEQIDARHLDREGFVALVNEKLRAVLSVRTRYRVPFEPTKEFEALFGKTDIGSVPALNPANVDSLLTNFIENDTGICCIDCEWVCRFPVPEAYIHYRILRYLYLNQVQAQMKGVSLEEMLGWFGFSEKELETFWEMEKRFQQHIHGEKWRYIYTERYKKENLLINEIDQKIRTVESENAIKARMIYDKDVHIRNLESMIGNLSRLEQEKDAQIQDQSARIKDQDAQIHDKDVHIRNQDAQIHDKDVHIRNQDSQIQSQKAQIQSLTQDYQTISNAFFWRITKPARALTDAIKSAIKKNESLYLFCRTAKDTMSHGSIYARRRREDYIRARRMDQETGSWPSEEERARQRRERFPKKIKFSILVPLYNTPDEFLRAMIQSVQDQTYKNWELCLADGSDAEHAGVGECCAELARKDRRIRYKKLDKNKGISENTNACIEMARGDYYVLFDHDDILHPSALYENMKAICGLGADFIYSDENTFHEDPSDAYLPHYKPDYSPDTLRSYNYICHLTVFKASLLDEVGGFRSQFDGSQDYDMILRLTEKAQHIIHIPKILYYWRGHPGSVASDVAAKPYTMDAAKAALTEHLARVGLTGKVLDSRIPTTYRIQYEIEGTPLISIVIPNMDHSDDLKKCIDSIAEKSTWKHWEIIVVENNSKEPETFEYYKTIEQRREIRIVKWEGPFNFSAICNFGARAAKGDYILLLNNDVQVITPDWLEQMLMFAQRSDVGAVGAMLYYPDDTIQHAGVILGLGGVAGHSHKYFERGHHGYASRLTIAQNLSAVTAACSLIPRHVWEEVEGLDEGFAVAFNDVDLCMRIRKAGYLIVWTPYAELYHFESKSRGYEDTSEKQKRFKGEIDRFISRWEEALRAGDPYYNLNLTLDREDFSPR